MGFDLITKRDCPHCGKEIGGGRGNLKTHMKKCAKKLGILEDVFVPVKEIKGENEMSLFVEVHSLEKGCQVIINLDHVIEIAPLVAGGCALFMTDGSNKISINVADSYELFKQFAMQTVSSEDIARKIKSLKGA